MAVVAAELAARVGADGGGAIAPGAAVGVDAAVSRQAPVPRPPVYGDPWQAQVWPLGHAESFAHSSCVQLQPAIGPFGMQRPFAPASLQLLSSLQLFGGPPPPLNEQAPGGAAVAHWASLGRW